VIDTGRGKLSAALDLRDEDDRRTFIALLKDADVLVQAYRPGALDAKGFGPQEAAAIRPGLIYGSLSAYGHLGPWKDRRGFDSLVQTATGFNDAEGRAAGEDGPMPLPCQALDHASGYLLALGIMMAIARRAREGGSWHVRVSLAGTGQWLRRLGRAPNGLAISDQQYEDILDLLELSDSSFGTLSAIRHSGILSRSKPFWAHPAAALGTHQPRWPE
jgi:hypothetical protein